MDRKRKCWSAWCWPIAWLPPCIFREGGGVARHRDMGHLLHAVIKFRNMLRVGKPGMFPALFQGFKERFNLPVILALLFVFVGVV